MNDRSNSENRPEGAESREDLSTLFAHLVIQQANMAMMLMGKVAHPETGKVIKDLDAGKLFIDQLEMLEVKTKGNLSKEEAQFLKQTLMSLRMAFVEAVEASPAPPKAEAEAGQKETPKPAPTATEGGSAPAEEEHRTKFSKKY
jgi:hypothetical protein